ncbi:hypothetical protein CCR75_002451 [Bremia lactucae]|uniref:Protein kinase domain-containing protein n=1 Tax=Bremia lactucae TaxID=4779 RepID=A0A976FHJ2_BRELC|nr:hypothetical protein CCR75_002451 [Bremia lactucae]
MLMMPAPSLALHVPPSLETVFIRMKDRSGTIAIDMTPSVLSPKEMIVRFHELAFGKSFAAFASNSCLLACRSNKETLVTRLDELQNGEVLVYKPCDELRTLVEQGCITPVFATPVDNCPSNSPMSLKRKGRAKSVTYNIERVHRYASDLAKMDVSPKERATIEDMLIVGDEQVVDAMEQFVVHRNSALVQRVLRGPAAKAVESLSMDFSSIHMHSPAVPTSINDVTNPFVSRDSLKRPAAKPQRPGTINKSTIATERPSLVFESETLPAPPIFLQSIQEKSTPPSGRMALSLSSDLDPIENPQASMSVFSVEKLLENVPVGHDFLETYRIGAVLGSGKYSVVKRCTNMVTNDECAVKIIDKRQMLEVRFLKRELEIMYGLQHNGVVRLIELFESNDSLYLVMELCGQELFEFIDRNGPLPETTTRLLIRKLVETVAYLHAQCIVHRDIKPENILLPLNSQDLSDIRLSDFGIARKLDGHGHDKVLTPHKSLSEVANLHDTPATNLISLPSTTDMVRNRMARAHTKCGTRDYIAPEVMGGKGYGTEADLWSVGVVTYVLLSGSAPVFLPAANGIKKVFFPDETWNRASDNVKSFIEALLVRNPDMRSTAADALEHPWLQESPA